MVLQIKSLSTEFLFNREPSAAPGSYILRRTETE